MLVSIRQLLNRSRRGEVRAVRAGLTDRKGSAEERELAGDLRALRRQIADELGPIDACRSCAHGLPAPEGRYAGGHCCSSDTHVLFSPDEASSLAMAGTRARHLATPSCEQAGCAFRGATGCSLEVEDRPNVCVMYLCTAARHELHDRGALDRAESLIAALEEDFAAFTRARAERRDRAERRAIDPRLD